MLKHDHTWWPWSIAYKGETHEEIRCYYCPARRTRWAATDQAMWVAVLSKLAWDGWGSVDAQEFVCDWMRALHRGR